MDVWILRHAAARDRAPTGRDEDRELTPEGLARATAVGRGLAALSPSIAVVLSSPFARALQTAEACSKALGLEPPRIFAPLLPGADPARTAEEVGRAGSPSVLLVGHQPLLGALVGFFVFGDPRRDIPLRKGALARVGWTPGGSGALEVLLPPEILENVDSGERRHL